MENTNFWNEKTYRNPDFINSPEARQIRILCELTAPTARFEQKGVENTIVFFGSARSICSEKAEKNLAELNQKSTSPGGNDSDIKFQIKKAESALKLSKYYDASVELAKKLSQWSMEINEKKDRFFICSGGGPGMMEAANLGASKTEHPSIGLNISLPFEQAPNPYQSPDLSFEFHYFFIRKFWFAYLAKALVVFPGGFGTMDELFEVLTLIQTKKITKAIPIVLFGKEFWNDFLNFDTLIKWGVINETDLDLFKIIDDVDEAYEYIKETLTKEYL